MKLLVVKALAAGLLATCVVMAFSSCGNNKYDDYEIEDKDVRTEELGELYTEAPFSEEALTEREQTVADAVCLHLDKVRAETGKFESQMVHGCDSKVIIDGEYYYFIQTVAVMESTERDSTKYIISTDFTKMHTVEVDNNPERPSEYILRVYKEDYAAEDLGGFTASSLTE